MIRFSIALKKAMLVSALKRSDVCERCDILPAALSKYLTARAHPKHGGLKKLVEVLSSSESKSLYYAYALDHLPVDVGFYLDICTVDDLNNSNIENSCSTVIGKGVVLAPELERAFNYLKKIAYESPTVAHSVINQSRILKAVDVTKIGD